MSLLLTAQEAAELTGYGTALRFRRAVDRGAMPPPHDPGARPQLWSAPAIKAALLPNDDKSHIDPLLRELDESLGLG